MQYGMREICFVKHRLTSQPLYYNSYESRIFIKPVKQEKQIWFILTFENQNVSNQSKVVSKLQLNRVQGSYDQIGT